MQNEKNMILFFTWNLHFSEFRRLFPDSLMKILALYGKWSYFIPESL